jgi:hypothetical protein
MRKIRTYQAITAHYIGPSNTKGSRIKATAAAGSLTVHYDDSLNSEQNHAKAAEALANKFKWSGRWFGGGLPDDRGYAFVCTDIDDDGIFFTQGEDAA